MHIADYSDPDVGLTDRPKICAPSSALLKAWVEKRGITWIRCGACFGQLTLDLYWARLLRGPGPVSCYGLAFGDTKKAESYPPCQAVGARGGTDFQIRRNLILMFSVVPGKSGY
jgi:hypothetical protein